jgi:hypothetical protein
VEDYHQRGGLRWGEEDGLRLKLGPRRYSNATWPFATLHATADALRIAVGVGPLKRRFTFSRGEVDSVALKHGLFSVGLQVHHSKSEYPPVVLFWTFNSDGLLAALRELGYRIGGQVDA